MTVPQRRLAGLWPWLLMAALQVVFGQTGLELAAAVESERLAPRAVIKVKLLNHEAMGKPITLEGEFVGGSAGSADGKLMQYHPLSLCNTSEDDRQESDFFITIVKLERQGLKCLPLLDKAKLALDRGAQAVIFDVSDDASAAIELQEASFLPHPVVLVKAEDAGKLMGLVNKNEEAWVRIEISVEPPKWPHYDVGILLTIVLAIVTIVLIFAFRYKCKSNRTWDSVHQQTMRAISRLESRTYSSQGCSASQRHRGAWGSASSSNSSPLCAICLEDFQEGQNLRILSCAHEFHKECVDPWLLQHRTCPLCMHNIMGTERQPQRRRLQPTPEHSQAFLHPHPYSGPHAHSYAQHAIPFSMRPQYPRGPSGPYPSLGHYSGSPPLDPQSLQLLSSHPPGSSCGYHLTAEGPGGRPLRGGAGCRTPAHLGSHYPPRHSCHAYRSACPVQRSASSSRLHHLPSSTPHGRGAVAHGRQEEGASCSGGSYRTDRSGYLADGPASDSSSGPCHGSSSDSVLNCTDVSLQGVYGSWSTFRSSLSSDYDPFVYYGPGSGRTEGGEQQTRPRSLDHLVNQAGCHEEPAPQAVFSHVHFHRHRHHHYEEDEPGQRRDRGLDEEQGTTASGPALPAVDRDSPPGPRKPSPCQCPQVEHTEMPGQGTEGLKEQEASSSSGPAVLVTPAPLQPSPPCCHRAYGAPPRRGGRLGGCVLEGPSVHFHQSVDLQDDCSIHIHYGQGPGYCCPPPELPPALLPVPLIMDSGEMDDWPCCGGPHVVWQKRVQPAHSEPQLQGRGAPMERLPCGFHHNPVADRNTDTCFYCQSRHNNQGSEEESGV